MSLVLTALKWLALIAAGAFVAFAVYIRVAGDDPAVWHKDPATVGLSGAVNEYIVSPSGDDAMRASPVYAMTPEALAAAFEAVALAKPGVTMLSNEGGFATYIQRTTVMASRLCLRQGGGGGRGRGTFRLFPVPLRESGFRRERGAGLSLAGRTLTRARRG